MFEGGRTAMVYLPETDVVNVRRKSAGVPLRIQIFAGRLQLVRSKNGQAFDALIHTPDGIIALCPDDFLHGRCLHYTPGVAACQHFLRVLSGNREFQTEIEVVSCNIFP